MIIWLTNHRRRQHKHTALKHLQSSAIISSKKHHTSKQTLTTPPKGKCCKFQTESNFAFQNKWRKPSRYSADIWHVIEVDYIHTGWTMSEEAASVNKLNKRESKVREIKWGIHLHCSLTITIGLQAVWNNNNRALSLSLSTCLGFSCCSGPGWCLGCVSE